MPNSFSKGFVPGIDNKIISTIAYKLFVISKVKRADLKLTHRYRWNNLEKPVLMRGPKALLAEFGSHHKFEMGEL